MSAFFLEMKFHDLSKKVRPLEAECRNKSGSQDDGKKEKALDELLLRR